MENNCVVCGGSKVSIRGRYPHTENRIVCPTCLAEKMDFIREYVDPNYGKQCAEIPKTPIKLEELK